MGVVEILYEWLLTHGVKIAGVVFAAWIAYMVSKRLIGRIVEGAVTARRARSEEELRRVRTITKAIEWVSTVFISLTALLIVLTEIGIDVTGILIAAGVLGVALGFGAQYIIRDFLAGIFILAEDQFRVGDVICVNGEVCGGVEDFTLRRTVLRDLDGIQHHIPNGEIRRVSNLSKGFARVHINISVAYKEDLDRVIRIVNEVCEEMAGEEPWKDIFIEDPITGSKAPRVLGVEELGQHGVTIKIVGSTKPLKQWGAMRELRLRIKKAFDKHGIEIPFPQLSVWPRGSWNLG